MRTNLGQYCGTLTSSQITEGMNTARQNARRLYEDARLLFEHRRYASAAALAVLAIEESGKLPILRELALARDEKAVRSAWRSFRSHTKKNAHWLIVEKFMRGARRASEFGEMFEPDADHPHLLDMVKQISFYSDCLGKSHWSQPEQVIDQDLAKVLLQIAEVLAQGREIQTDEIDLWVQYMQPVWGLAKSPRERALFEWDKELRRRGIVKNGSTTMEEFFTRGLVPMDPEKK